MPFSRHVHNHRQDAQYRPRPNTNLHLNQHKFSLTNVCQPVFFTKRDITIFSWAGFIFFVTNLHNIYLVSPPSVRPAGEIEDLASPGSTVMRLT